MDPHGHHGGHQRAAGAERGADGPGGHQGLQGMGQQANKTLSGSF